jgi:asparagine synthase (glutamine-hydrolysing)
MSMASGVEVRVPYLDLELVNFACRLPPRLKLKGGVTKYLLKKVAERYLPKKVIHRSKTGFGAPVRSWFMAGSMDPIIEHYLNEERVRRRAIFDAVHIRELVARTKAGTIDAVYVIWALLAMESWMTQFTPGDAFEPFGAAAVATC